MFQVIGCFDVVENGIFRQGRRRRRLHPSTGKAAESLNNKTANGSQYFHIQFNANLYLSENKAKWKQKSSGTGILNSSLFPLARNKIRSIIGIKISEFEIAFLGIMHFPIFPRFDVDVDEAHIDASAVHLEIAVFCRAAGVKTRVAHRGGVFVE